MKKRGKIASSRIEFGLDALKEELEKIKTRKVTTNKKPKVKISNFLRKKSSNAKWFRRTKRHLNGFGSNRFW